MFKRNPKVFMRHFVTQSAGKIIESVFWDVHGVIHIDYLEKGKTITAKYYRELLGRFNAAVKTKRPHSHRILQICTSAIVVRSQT